MLPPGAVSVGGAHEADLIASLREQDVRCNRAGEAAPPPVDDNDETLMFVGPVPRGAARCPCASRGAR